MVCLKRIFFAFFLPASLVATAGDTGQPARPIETPSPQYPDLAYSQGHQGKTLLTLQVLPDGGVGTAEIKESSRSPALDETALASVKKWKFSPATDSAGNAIASRVVVPVAFWKDSVGTVMKKPCSDLNADVQFFKEAFPELPLADMRISKLTLGMLVVTVDSLDKRLALGKGFSRAFEIIVQKCETTPGDTYGNVLASTIKESKLW